MISRLNCVSRVLAVLAIASATSLSFAEEYRLGIPFGLNGSSPPAGPGPWLSATVTSDGGGGAYLTMNSLLTSSTEFVSEWLFNLDPSLNVGSLSITYQASPYPNTATVSTGTDAFQADGDGMFDILFDFPNAPPGSRFNDGDSVTYLLTYPGVDLLTDCGSPSGQCIDFFSSEGGGQGTYKSAAHVQGTNGGLNSQWIGTIEKVPEPATMCLLSAGLLLLSTRSRRR